MYPLAHAFFKDDNDLGGLNNESDATLQHGFNLTSRENASDPGAMNQRFLRQTALYHSFNVKTGKCAWFVLKGNNLIGNICGMM
jgi:hypothetical protein